MIVSTISGACLTLLTAEKALKDIGITPRQLVVLDHVNAGHGKFMMGNIAGFMDVTPAVLTGLGDRLEKRGYVTRTNGTDDRRRVYISITELGRDVLGQAKDALKEVY
jgi:DNA-binding MarR family transcriptional regulator